MLSPRDAFKVGFLARCVEEGLTPEEIHTRVKVSMDKLAGLLSSVVDAGKSVAGGAMKYGVPAALAAPPILGGLAGFGLARATDVSDEDVEEIKNRELIDELNRQTQRLNREKQIRDFRAQRKKTGRILLG